MSEVRWQYLIGVYELLIYKLYEFESFKIKNLALIDSKVNKLYMHSNNNAMSQPY